MRVSLMAVGAWQYFFGGFWTMPWWHSPLQNSANGASPHATCRWSNCKNFKWKRRRLSLGACLCDHLGRNCRFRRWMSSRHLDSEKWSFPQFVRNTGPIRRFGYVLDNRIIDSIIFHWKKRWFPHESRRITGSLKPRSARIGPVVHDVMMVME